MSTEGRPHGRLAPERAINQFRSELPWLIAQTASAIQAEISAYAGPIRGERRATIETALASALNAFADYTAGQVRLDVNVAALFENLGWAEGFDGHTSEALRGAFSVTNREVWVALSRVTFKQGLTVQVLVRLGDALFTMAARLWDQIEDGYRQGQHSHINSRPRLRAQFARHLLGTEAPCDLSVLAESAGWRLPPTSLVLCAELPGHLSDLEPELSEAGAMVLGDEAHVLAVCDERVKEPVLNLFARLIGDGAVTISPPASPSRLADAAKLALRAQSLIGANLIDRAPVVECSDHLVMLWLRNEPMVLECLVDKLLAPLEGLTARRRMVLATTMVTWLEQRASAPAIAARLGVHPQTVRYRLRQINGLMGSRVDDPEIAFQMLVTLKAVLPVWAASARSK